MVLSRGGSFTPPAPQNRETIVGQTSDTGTHLQLPVEKVQVVRRSWVHPIGTLCCTGSKSCNIFKHLRQNVHAWALRRSCHLSYQAQQRKNHRPFRTRATHQQRHCRGFQDTAAVKQGNPSNSIKLIGNAGKSLYRYLHNPMYAYQAGPSIPRAPVDPVRTLSTRPPSKLPDLVRENRPHELCIQSPTGQQAILPSVHAGEGLNIPV